MGERFLLSNWQHIAFFGRIEVHPSRPAPRLQKGNMGITQLLRLSLLASCLALSAAAQQSGGPPASDAPAKPQPQGDQQTGQEKDLQKKEQSQRILGIAPMFGITSRQNAAPLTKGEKFHLFTKSAFDPFNFASAGFQAGLGQLQNEFAGYGQGAAGYGKRYGASFADQVSSSFFSNYLYPVLLKEDPRYFRLGEGPIKRRIMWSLEQEFVCRTDSKKRSFNWSNVLGAFSAGGLSNAYYPSTDRGLGLTMSRSVISLGYGSVGGLVDEFWPDIQRKLLSKHNKNQKASSTKEQH